MAIACQSDAAWQRLCGVMGFADAARDAALAHAPGRLAQADALDARISAWTGTRPEAHIEEVLIAAGVAAHRMQNSPECWEDPQLTHRRHFVTVPHTTLGDMVVEGTRFKLSRTPGGPRHAGPVLGEHNAQVLQDILGYDDERIADAFASLAVG